MTPSALRPIPRSESRALRFGLSREPGRAFGRGVAFATALGLSTLMLACGGEPPGAPGGSTPGTDGTAGQAAAATEYDPAKDPLVNPPSLFEPPPEDRAAISEDETLVRTLRGAPETLNPIFYSSQVEGQATDLLFDGLFSFDEKLQWFVNRRMVAEFSESEDHLVSRVVLQEGLKWHDGAPLTAEDVRFSWEAILDPKVPCPAVKSGTDQIEDVKVIDARTIEFHHKEAVPTSKWNMLFPIIPKHLHGNPEERAKDPSLSQSEYFARLNREGIVGNGPYRFVEWRAQDRIVVERWDGWNGEKPRFKRQVLMISTDDNVALQLFNKGELDELEMTALQFATQTNGPDFAKHGVKAYAPEWGFYYIGWNMDGSNPFFADPKVRVAMARACDVDRVIKTVIYGLADRCLGIYHPTAPMFNPEVKAIEYDLARAAEELEAAGWKLSDDDGFRYKDVNGASVKFEFTLNIPQGSSSGPRVAAIYGEDLKKIGVSMKTRVLEWVAFQEQSGKHEFEAQIAGWGTGTDPDTNWNLWHSTEYAEGRNYGGYANPKVDELLLAGRREFDPAKRNAIYAEIQKIVYDDQAYLFLYNAVSTQAFHKRLRGVEFSPRGVTGFEPSHLRWWVAKQDAMRVP